MILYYPGNRPDIKSDVLSLLKGKDVKLIYDEQKPISMEELSILQEIPQGEGTGEPFLFWIDENPQQVTGLQKELHTLGKDINRMAMKTQHNMAWTFGKLYEEVSAEARWFETRDQLIDLIHAADSKRMEREPKYAQAVMSCAALLSSDHEIPQRLLDLAVEMLAAANENR